MCGIISIRRFYGVIFSMGESEMIKTYDKSATAHLADHIYKNAKMGADSISDALKGIKDPEEKEKIKAELTRQLSEYESFATRSEQILTEMNVRYKEEGMMAKLGAKAGIMMNMMKDSTSSHVAEMMIEGLSMGVTDTTKRVRRAEENGGDPEAIKLANEFISFQEKSIDIMKKYL